MQRPGKRARPPFRWAVRLYDRTYRRVHGLDRLASQVGPALCVELRPCRRTIMLPDGALVRRGDLVGILHLNNARIAAVHSNGLPAQAIGLEFRRQFLASLADLARLAAMPGPLAGVRAFSATTIFHTGLARLGFAVERDGLLLPWLVAACQRFLHASLHPRGALRFRRASSWRARRVWLTREALLARYGGPPAGDPARRPWRLRASVDGGPPRSLETGTADAAARPPAPKAESGPARVRDFQAGH